MFVAVILSVMGCQHPMEVFTQSRIAVETPVSTYSQVHFDSPVETTARIEVDKPLETTARLMTPEPIDTKARIHLEYPHVAAPGRIQVMPVGPAAGASGGARVAIVDIDGLLVNVPCVGPFSHGENPVSLLREKLEAIGRDPSIGSVVLRINSPGGSVAATDVMWHELTSFHRQRPIPMVACLMDVGAGGGYYLATAADVIVANPTTVTGGIGVILNLYNLRELMSQFNVLSQEIKAGPLIDMGTPTAKLPKEARDLLQGMANEFHGRFQHVVKSKRPQAGERQDTFDGRVFTGLEAHTRGLVDRLGYLDDAIALATEMAGQPAAQPVMLHRPQDLARSIYDVTPNVPIQSGLWPVDVPGINRASLPTFLYLWQPESTLEKLPGR